MRRSKQLLIILTAFILLNVFSGCSYFNNPQEKRGSAGSSAATSPEKITVIFPGTENASSMAVKSEIEKKLIGSVNVMLDFKWVPLNQYPVALRSKLAAAEEFDAFMPSSSELRDLVKDDYLLDITSIFPKNAPGVYKLYKENEYKNFPYSVAVSGKIYAVPSLMPGSSRVCAMVREDLMQQYGIPPIKTLDDYEVYLKTVKEKNSGAVPMVWMDGTIESLVEVLGYGMVQPFLFYKWDDKDLKLIPCEETEEFRTAVELVKGWFEKGYVDMSSYSTAYRNGAVFSYLENWHNAFNDKYSKFPDVPLTPYPLNLDKTTERRPITDKVLAFSKNSQHAAAVLKFFDWVQAGQENYDLFMHGISGENYTISGDKISYTKDKPIYTGWSGSSSFVNLSFLRPLPGDSKNFRELYKQIANTNTRENPASEFVPDLNAVKTQAETRLKYFMSLESALKTSSTKVFVEEFIDLQKKAGSAELTAAIQKQLNSWLANKK